MFVAIRSYRRHRLAICVLSACVLALLYPSIAASEEPNAPAPSVDDIFEMSLEELVDVEVEEITVTARKREENLQVTPLSVTSLGVAQIEDATALTLVDLSNMVPNLRIDTGATGYSARAYSRGIGTADPIVTRDPSVGIYLDGVYLPRGQGSLRDLAEIERVEVLRGPQGTLYGRNTIGGAVNLISKKPDLAERFADMRVRYGNYRFTDTQGSVNLPLVPEKLGIRISGGSRSRQGYGENLLHSEYGDDERYLGGRTSVLWQPFDGFDALFSADATREHSTGRAGQCRYSATSQAALGQVPSIVPAVNGATGFSTLCNASGARDIDYSANQDGEIDLDTMGFASTLSWELSDALRVKSISSWRRVEVGQDWDIDYTSVAFGSMTDSEQDQADTWSQEFTFSGSAFADSVDWTTGLYSFWEKTRPGLPITLAAPGVVGLGLSFAELNKTDNQNFAWYGQATWRTTDRLALTGGVRRLTERKGWEHKRFALASLTTLGAQTVGIDTSDRFDAWTGMFNVSYDVTDEMMLYGQWARGYKSGGFNGRTNPALPATLEGFDPEKLNSFELGMKSEWLERRLVLNASVFHQKSKNLQQTLLSADASGQFASIVRNAAKATIRGAEVEVRAVPFRGFSLFSSLGVTDAKYEENARTKRDNLPATTTSLVDRKHEDFFNTPAYNLIVGGSYQVPTRAGLLTLGSSWYGQSEVNFSPSEDMQGSGFAKQGKYALVDSRVSMLLNDGVTEIALFGKNLFDRRYIDNAIDLTDGFAVVNVSFGAPRTFGIEISRAIDF